MDRTLGILFENLGSKDDKVRFAAFTALLARTEQEVSWFEEYRELLVKKLADENSYQRSIGVKLLCNLAKSDRKKTLRTHLDLILAHTSDDKFITSRQALQHVWKIAVADGAALKKITGHLEKRFRECGSEKHANLSRQDIVASLVKIREHAGDAVLGDLPEKLVASEPDLKTRKKLAALLKG